jgi:hypothetical protein
VPNHRTFLSSAALPDSLTVFPRWVSALQSSSWAGSPVSRRTALPRTWTRAWTRTELQLTAARGSNCSRRLPARANLAVFASRS